MSAVRDEVVDRLQRLIRVDTSNPPGRETAAAQLLAGDLAAAGLECELCGPDPERQNLVARLRGRGGPVLALLGHTDVVPAPADNWTVDPFAGVVRDGRVVGRGAADMKGELAARATALAVLAREGFVPAGDVLLIAEADEERNTADVGLSWLARERPDLRPDLALNEGGGTLLRLADGRRAVTMSIGELQVTSLRVRLHGRAGHATAPETADNPLAHLATAIRRLCAPPAAAPSGAARALLDALGVAGAAAAAALHPELGRLARAAGAMAITPTGTATTEPANVIPPSADLICDCRALPGQTEADVRAHLATLLHGLEHDAELLEPLTGGTASPTGTPLHEAIAAWVQERVPGALLLPVVSPGFTDSHWLRAAHGTVAYGFAPVLAMDPQEYEAGVHGADEALLVDDLVTMTEFHVDIIRALAQSAQP